MSLQNLTTVNPQAVALAGDAVREFHAQCFWFWGHDVDVSKIEIINDVIDGLRRRGGRKAWFAAQRISECL